MSELIMKKLFPIFLFLLIAVSLLFNACKKETPGPFPEPVPLPDTSETPVPAPIPDSNAVSVDLTLVPYPKLSDYKFFKGVMKDQIPSDAVLPYEPASSLFTDYALKKRFIYVPSGRKANYVADNKVLNVPIGTALIKTFYYDHVQPGDQTQIIETRVMIKKFEGWIFAEYVWNEEQTEATLQMNGSFKNLSWLHNGNPKSTTYRIPSETECLTCHKVDSKAIPIGIKPQNLNTNYTYSTGTSNQLQYWISRGILNNTLPGSIHSTVDYHDVSQPLKTRLRSYLDANCSHCHQENSHCDYRPLRLAFSETHIPSNMGLCVTPDEEIDPVLIQVIVPGNVTKSMMHFRMNSTDENTRMPLLGRTLVDDVGITLLRDYILSIDDCND